MALKRIDNVAIVLDDLDGAIAFFEELGMQVEGERMTVGGEWVDRVVGLEGTQSEIVMMRTPDGHGRLELTRFQYPEAIGPDPKTEPVNRRGMGRIMFTVEDIDDVVARLQARGGELVAEVVRYENAYRLCYMRGPEGIVIALAEELG